MVDDTPQIQPAQVVTNKLAGDHFENVFESQLLQQIPSHFETQQLFGGSKPDFAIYDDDGVRLAFVDSKSGAWDDDAQAAKWVQLASDEGVPLEDCHSRRYR